MSDLLTEYLPQILIVAGLVILAVEVAILGFATFVLFFIGIGLTITGTLMLAGVMDATHFNMVLGVTLITALSAALFWRPLKTMQNQTELKPVTSDIVGHRFILDASVSNREPARYKYSGIQWQVVSSQPIEAGAEVEVTAAEVGKLKVVPVVEPK